MKKDWIDRLADPFEKIPIIGVPIGAVIIMTVGMAYWVLWITLFTFVLIPYSAIRGLINPNNAAPAWNFLFGDTRRIDSPNRLDFAVLLAFYVLLYGFLILIVFNRR